MIQAAIFDFDGLILDTEWPIYQGWAEVYEDYGEHLPEAFWTTIIGRGANYFDAVADLERRLGRRLDGEGIRARRSARVRELLDGMPIMPGVQAWLAEARSMGLRLAVASSSGRAWVVGHLERLGLDGWDCVRCLEDVERTKPAPDVYLASLGCLGVEAGHALALEDSAAGVAAARAAGVYCVAVPNSLTTGHDFGRADLVLGSLAERSLAEVLAMAGGR